MDLPSFDAFKSALGDRASAIAHADLEAVASILVAAASSEHPELDAGAPFLAHVALHASRIDAPLLEALGSLHAADLLLASACARGDDRALKKFHERYSGDVLRVARRVRASGVDPEDLAQELARRVFGPPSPKIVEYSGRGDLRAWVRIVATRLSLDVARVKRSGERPTDHEAFRGLAAAADAPELAYFRRLYQAEVRAAIETAAKKLAPDERLVLRDHYVLGRSIDDVAEAEGVHRATAARRVQRAREALALAVKEVLAERHGLEGRELVSVMNLVRSQMNITMERLFA